MKLIALGTGGFIPTASRETACFLVIEHNIAFLLDAGSGVKWLNDDRIKGMLSGIKNMNLLLSHFHHDHIAGLPWLYKLVPCPLNIYAPCQPLVDYNGLDALKTYISPPYFERPLDSWPNLGKLVAINKSTILIEGIEVNCLRQKHPGGSVAYRIGSLAYITDADAGDEQREFLRGCSVALMDTMFNRAEYESKGFSSVRRGSHGYGHGNATIARDTGIAKLGLIHLHPMYSQTDLVNLLTEARKVFDQSIILETGEVIFVD